MVDPGNTLGFKGGGTVLADGRVAADLGASYNVFRIGVIYGDLSHLADIDAIELDVRALGKVGHRTDEDDIIEVVVLGELQAGQPDDENYQADE